jgi:hypothetical protein
MAIGYSGQLCASKPASLSLILERGYGLQAALEIHNDTLIE